VRRAVTVLLSLALIGGSAGAATATDAGAPPSHDTIEGATVVTKLPFTDTVDISTATAGPEDQGGGCFFGASTTVWYRYTPAADVLVDLTTAGSDFDTTLEVFTGNRTFVDCDDEGGGFNTSRLIVPLAAGQEYLIRAAGYFENTGTLVLSMSEFVPIEVTVAIGDTGRLTPGGRAVVDVTVACNRPADVHLFYDGRQAIGPATLTGTARRVVHCRREVRESVRLDPATGAFLPGLLDVGYSVTACEPGFFFFEGCVDVEGTETVLLVPGP
jgi:hypothetical protein